MDLVFLKEVDRVEIAVLVDNYSNGLLPDTDCAKRMRILPPGQSPMAEHGLSCMIKVFIGKDRHTILMDAGVSGSCLEHNAGLMAKSRAVADGIVTADVKDVESVFLSHGHYDHFGGLVHYLSASRNKMPLVLHPYAFTRRRSKRAGLVFQMPKLDESALANAGAVIKKETGPNAFAGGTVLSTGEVKRYTDFEKSPKTLEAEINGEWVPDPFTDDQALAVKVKNRGLVVVGGCSHAGIVNTIATFQELTGTERIHAVLGGFHLSGADDEVIEPTVEEIKRLAPDVVVPMHCTGWEAMCRFAREMPERFVLNSVGTTYVFGKAGSDSAHP